MMSDMKMFIFTQMIIISAMISYKMIFSQNQILLLLLNLELLALLGVLTLIMIHQTLISPMIIFTFFVLIVCEASLGLSLLINMTRDWGSENLNN